MQRRDRGVAQSLGLNLTRKVKESRVLLVGAGGIGCEVLKNLVCCGFGSGLVLPQNANANAGAATAIQSLPSKKAEIVVIDLDTIDLSNLNRQFLFRKQHIKKPKAYVAKETASGFNPHVNIDAHHASIFDNQYDVAFFERFDIVFNALDNLAARRHVNRMCLAADVPLIESGTTGFNGQVQAIKKGTTECYDCNEKPVQKSFPICTIRSTPSQPIHCIVWAKSYLLPELFGTSEEDSSDVAVTGEDNAEEVAKLKEEAEALKNIRSLMGKEDFAKEVFNKVYGDDIDRLRSMSEMWQSRTPPTPLRFEKVCIDKDPEKPGAELATQDQNIWSLLDNLKVFCYSMQQLSKRVADGESAIEFDKDDKDTLDFVAAAANLRSHVFSIPLNSEWDIKQMAGNIIPAIATSNALTASLCVLEAFKVMRGQTPKQHSSRNSVSEAVAPATNGNTGPLLGGSKMVFLNSKSTDRMITTEQLHSPRKDCPVCSPFYAKLTIKEGSNPTLQALVDLLKDSLNYEDMSMVYNEQIIYDPDLEDNLEKPLAELGIDGKSINFLTVQDDADEAKVDLVLSIKVKETTGDEEVALSPSNPDMPLKPPKPAPQTNGDAENDGSDPTNSGTELPIGKRKREAEDDAEPASKRAKAKAEEEAYVIEDDGAILLD
ncbi:Putative THIF-type NAD/FAD binding, ubiquitin-activating enzyme, SCCH domain, ThiF/MoeB/HesA family [Septoria linicola]|uniref:Ubiquitin-activating enzyme E1-like n=1 Tax=Septoria linicola TaxID=215465 RepID=A0A9Q9B481_9PEZI|nr:putative THIF-type NAD/FAD binding, ubiquitin-activating enzyme, SCCH domain, ThiF/MoeB/HesA family [Septoria linicola]USW57087.1 Putative THIF-type NAD/FAD binding, ubiquitin-activating enzyme, SCCH domain, ThiF/MoeB/HesA family [Septoria linicola]